MEFLILSLKLRFLDGKIQNVRQHKNIFKRNIKKLTSCFDCEEEIRFCKSVHHSTLGSAFHSLHCLQTYGPQFRNVWNHSSDLSTCVVLNDLNLWSWGTALRWTGERIVEDQPPTQVIVGVAPSTVFRFETKHSASDPISLHAIFYHCFVYNIRASTSASSINIILPIRLFPSSASCNIINRFQKSLHWITNWSLRCWMRYGYRIPIISHPGEKIPSARLTLHSTKLRTKFKMFREKKLALRLPLRHF